LTTVYNFCSQSGCADGEIADAGLIQARNGNLYGTTSQGGLGSDAGTVFEISPSGALTTLYRFCSQKDCPDGKYPVVALVQAGSGNLYGTTYVGGAHGEGTVFKITAAGMLTTLYSFCTVRGCSDGKNPSGLIQAIDGNFYGTTNTGGLRGYGTVFQVTPSGTVNTLYNFCSYGGCRDGANSRTGLIQDTNGNLYGTTSKGGTFHDGELFGLSVGLGPFVETQRTSGKVGAAVKILGTDLTGATSVAFNGTAAVFKVVSSSLITTTVPTGATTGFVTVTTLSGTLTSNQKFRVIR